uniref:Conomap-Vt n=1 Tax=Conus planorbis TaxID=97183 RepID=CMAT_CONPO|nr:RecName: Full=Conomap-Vt; Short=Conp-Vt [Conus planorbis]
AFVKGSAQRVAHGY